MRRLLPLLFLLILPHPVTIALEGCLLATRDFGYLTKAYAANTAAVATAMRAVAVAAAAGAAAAGAAGAAPAARGAKLLGLITLGPQTTVLFAWGGLVAWNFARLVEHGARLSSKRGGQKLLGARLPDLLFKRGGVRS